MIIGCDISVWNDNPDNPEGVNFKRMKNMGIDFVFMRSSYGSMPDTRYLINMPRATDAGLITGSYHYLTWKDSIQSQLNTIVNLQKQYPSQIPIVVDVEERSGCPAQLTAGKLIKQLLDSLRTELGVVPGVYTNVGSWASMGYINEEILPFWLWVANWNVKTPRLPVPWKNWTFWQYTISSYGYMFGVQSKSIDLDAFNGSLDDLKTWIATVR
jgi:lysozyme